MSELRIGTRERELAMATLDIHHAEGRLDADEYRERSVAAATARHRSDLDVLFADLPAPHPPYPEGAAGRDGVGAPTAGPPVGPDAEVGDPVSRPDGPADAPRRAGSGRGPADDLPELVAPLGAALGRNAGKLSALVPVVAVVLFVLTGFRFPLIFLLVPVALGILGYLGHRESG